MDNKNVDEIPVMRPNEETAILDVIENDIAASTKDTTVYI